MTPNNPIRFSELDINLKCAEFLVKENSELKRFEIEYSNRSQDFKKLLNKSGIIWYPSLESANEDLRTVSAWANQVKNIDLVKKGLIAVICGNQVAISAREQGIKFRWNICECLADKELSSNLAELEQYSALIEDSLLRISYIVTREWNALKEAPKRKGNYKITVVSKNGLVMLDSVDLCYAHISGTYKAGGVGLQVSQHIKENEPEISKLADTIAIAAY